MSFVITLDGPAASGKSSVSRVLAQRLGAVIVNSGAMYRALTWAALEAGLQPSDTAGLAAWVKTLEVTCGQKEGSSTITINGRDPAPHLRDQSVNTHVSAVSAVPEVRSVLVEKLREYAQLGKVVMEGRDIGSVVFPDSPYKYFVDACEEVRAQRRSAQGEVDSVAQRDAQDSTRKVAPLVVPQGAVRIDSSQLTLEQVVEAILADLAAKGLHQASAA